MNPIRKRWSVLPSTFVFFVILYGLLALLTIIPGKALFFSMFSTEHPLSRWAMFLIASVPLVALSLCVCVFFYTLFRAHQEKKQFKKRFSLFRLMLVSAFSAILPFVILTLFVVPSLMQSWRLPQINEVLEGTNKVASAYYLERESIVRKVSDNFLSALAINKFQRDSVASWEAIKEIDSAAICIQIMKINEETSKLELFVGAGNSDQFLKSEEIENIHDGIYSSFVSRTDDMGYTPSNDLIVSIRTVNLGKTQFKAAYTSAFYLGFDADISAVSETREQFSLNEKLSPITTQLWIALTLLVVLPSLLFLVMLFYRVATRFTAVWEVLVESIERKTAGSNTLHIYTDEIHGEEKVVSAFINKE